MLAPGGSALVAHGRRRRGGAPTGAGRHTGVAQRPQRPQPGVQRDAAGRAPQAAGLCAGPGGGRGHGRQELLGGAARRPGLAGAPEAAGLALATASGAGTQEAAVCRAA